MEESDTEDANGNYHFLENPPADAEYIISMPPMNSSGDIYVILAFLILSRAHKKPTPKVLLTYDGSNTLESSESKLNTHSQTQRSLSFAQWVGFDEHFYLPQHINTGKSQRENNRYDKLIGYFSSLNREILFIEQKALTSLVADHFLKYGREKTTHLLNTGFSCRGSTLSDNDKTKISEYANTEIVKIKKSCKKKPLVILQFRYSSHANDHQNTDTRVIERLKDYVEQKGYAVWFIFTDGRVGYSSFKEITDCRSDPFIDACNATKEKIDHGKLYHLQLLQQLLLLNNLRGVIGNTSGTLDLAAFIGHRVYNLHNFKDALDYQGYRILIQTSFLSVEYFNGAALRNSLLTPKGIVGVLEEDTAAEHLPNLTPWLEETDRDAPCKFPQKKLRPEKVTTHHTGYKDLFFFTKIVGVSAPTLKALPCAEKIQAYVNKRHQNRK